MKEQNEKQLKVRIPVTAKRDVDRFLTEITGINKSSYSNKILFFLSVALRWKTVNLKFEKWDQLLFNKNSDTKRFFDLMLQGGFIKKTRSVVYQKTGGQIKATCTNEYQLTEKYKSQQSVYYTFKYSQAKFIAKNELLGSTFLLNKGLQNKYFIDRKKLERPNYVSSSTGTTENVIHTVTTTNVVTDEEKFIINLLDDLDNINAFPTQKDRYLMGVGLMDFDMDQLINFRKEVL